MQEKSKLDLEEVCKNILDNAPQTTSKDKKMRYLYHELGMNLAKSTEFFYDASENRRLQIYENYQVIEKMEVICRNAVSLYCNMAEKLDIKCTPLECKNNGDSPINHWAIIYENDNKRYLINPIPDFFRIQMGFSTQHFCHTSDYKAYDGMPFDSMTDEYLRKLDQELGYLAGNLYTEELLGKLSGEIASKIGTHIIKTTDTYQDYYLKLLDTLEDDSKSLEEKMESFKEIDPQFEKNQSIIKECLEERKITGKMRKTMREVSFQQLLHQPPNLDREREGAKYLGTLDTAQLKNLKKEILIYKFNYMLESLSQFMRPLTGFIEKKNFIDECKNYFFNVGNEKNCIHRHTVRSIEDGKKEYYMMFSISPKENEEKIYCFYNPQTGKKEMGIEPLSFMKENKLEPLSNTSLQQVLIDQLSNDELYKPNISKETINKK